MIRFIFVCTFIILFLILSIPLLIVEWLIGKFNMNLKNRTSLAIVKWTFHVCLFITGTRITVLGEENVPQDTPVLYVANHRSFFDILLTYTRVPRPTGYVAKKEILKYPLLRDWMKNLHCLFMNRDNLKEALKTILEGVNKIKSGISICIFPEGTRSEEEGAFLPFHEGSFKIAEKSGCPIVPICINNSAAIWENHFPRMKKAHVVIEYSAPVIISELSKEDRKFIGAYTQHIIEQMHAKNRALV